MIKNSKQLLNLSVFCFVVMTAAVLFLFVYPFFAPNADSLDQQSFIDNGTKPLDGFIVDGNAESLYPFTDDTVLQVSANSVEMLNMQGMSNASQSIDTKEPKLVSNLNYALIYDNKGLNYYLFDRYGLVYSAKAKAPIYGARLANDGHVALIMQTENSKGSLRLMAPNGKHLFDYDIKDRQNSGFLLSAAFSNDGNYLDLSLLNTDGVKTYPLVTRFSMKSLKVVANYQIDYNGSLPLLLRGSENNLLLLSNSQAFHLLNQEFKQWFTIAELKEAVETLNGIAILAAKSYQGDLRIYYVDATDSEPRDSNSVPIGNDPKLLVSNRTHVALCDTDTAYRINMQNMKLESFKLNSEVIRVGIDSKNRLTIISKNKVLRV